MCIFGKIAAILSEEGTFSLKAIEVFQRCASLSLKDASGSLKVFIDLSFPDHTFRITRKHAFAFLYGCHTDNLRGYKTELINYHYLSVIVLIVV